MKMNKINIVLAIAVIVFFSASTQIAKADTVITPTNTVFATNASTTTETSINTWPQIQAQSAIVYDPISNIVYYEKSADTVRPLASIAKLATTAVTEDLLYANPSFANRLIFIKKGSTENNADKLLKNGTAWTLDNLIKYMLIGSSNKAAENIANSLIPKESFISLMNYKAKQWGLINTKFYNASGLTTVNKSVKKPGAESTAREISKLIWHIIAEYPNVLDVTRDPVGTFSSDSDKIVIKNTNKLLESIPIIFGKTGFTELAGGNLAIVVQKKPTDHAIVIVVMGSTEEGRFDDASALYNSLNTILSVK